MTTAQKIQIVTVYNAATSPRTKNRIRRLSLVSLIVAVVWIWAVWFPVDRKLKRTWLLAGIAGATDTMGQPQPDIWVALGLQPPPRAPNQTRQNEAETTSRIERQMAILTIELYTWKGVALLAGGWLTLAALVGLLGARTSLRMHRQAALLMILSTIASVSGIWIAIHWGGLPDVNAPLYGKIAAVQSAYAWFLLIATRLLR